MKRWYQITSYTDTSQNVETVFEGKNAKARARGYCKQMSKIQDGTEFVINGYDLDGETWKGGKRDENI